MIGKPPLVLHHEALEDPWILPDEADGKISNNQGHLARLLWCLSCLRWLWGIWAGVMVYGRHFDERKLGQRDAGKDCW